MAPKQNIGDDFRGVSVTSHQRYERLQGFSEKRRRSKCTSALLELTCHQPSDENEEADEDSANIEDSTVKEFQTDITVDYISGLEKDDASLKEKLKMSCFNEDSLKNTMTEFVFILDRQIGHFCYVCLPF